MKEVLKSRVNDHLVKLNSKVEIKREKTDSMISSIPDAEIK
jgi:hypothetical protein